MSQLGDRPDVRIIRMRKIPFIDSTGIHNLTLRYAKCQRGKRRPVIFPESMKKVHKVLEKSGILWIAGKKENICPNIYVALDRAKEVMQKKTTDNKIKKRAILNLMTGLNGSLFEGYQVISCTIRFVYKTDLL